jgi:hypothetical protein
MRKPCQVCAIKPAQLKIVNETIETEGRNRALATLHAFGYELTDHAVRYHRANCMGIGSDMAVVPVSLDVREPAGLSADGAYVKLGATGGEIYTGMLDHPIGSEADILNALGVDPDKYMIVQETATISRWQGHVKNALEEMEVGWLHSLKARIKPRNDGNDLMSEEDFIALLKTVRDSKPTIVKATGKDATVLLCAADLQLGKGEGGGSRATVERFKTSMAEGIAYIRRQQLRYTVREAALAQMGDPTEGCYGQYANQLFTTDLNQRDQVLLAVELLYQAILDLLEVVERVKFVTVHSNHGQWTRFVGNKSVTDDSDTVDGHIADMLALLFKGDDRVEFITPKDNMVTTTYLSGVPFAFAHGHTATSANQMLTWLKGQTEGQVYLQNFRPEGWVTAHSHHAKMVDCGPYTWWQCPSEDGGSKWFYDAKGAWSTPGMMCVTVGRHTEQRCWSDYVIV